GNGNDLSISCVCNKLHVASPRGAAAGMAPCLPFKVLPSRCGWGVMRGTPGVTRDLWQQFVGKPLIMSANNQSGLQLGLPGLEHLTLTGILRLFMRRKWLITLTTLLLGTLAATAGYFIPNKYRATTVIMVDPRKVPDNFVAPTVASGVADRLATLRQRILSSTNLTEVMNEMKLYPELRTRRTQEELVQLMAKNIEILVSPPSGDRGEGTFKISFQ